MKHSAVGRHVVVVLAVVNSINPVFILYLGALINTGVLLTLKPKV